VLFEPVQHHRANSRRASGASPRWRPRRRPQTSGSRSRGWPSSLKALCRDTDAAAHFLGRPTELPLARRRPRGPGSGHRTLARAQPL